MLDDPKRLGVPIDASIAARSLAATAAASAPGAINAPPNPLIKRSLVSPPFIAA
jgi:hypothetical protein